MNKEARIWIHVTICLACSLVLIVLSVLSFRYCWQMGTRIIESVQYADPELLWQARFLRGLSLSAPLLFTWVVWSLLFNQLMRPVHNNRVYHLSCWLQRRGLITNHWLFYRRVARTMKVIARVG